MTIKLNLQLGNLGGLNLETGSGSSELDAACESKLVTLCIVIKNSSTLFNAVNQTRKQ